MAMDFGKLNFAVGFNRTSAFPLDANSYFESYDAAVAAVAGAAEVGSADSAYYIGQLIIVKDAEVGVGLYQINAGKTLTKFGQASSADELVEKISALETRCTTIEGKLILATADKEGLMSKEDFAKLTGIEAGAQVNKIESVKVNGEALSITEKAVNIDLSAYAKTADVNTELDKKVDAVEGKGLSTNDYDNAAKAIVDGVTAALEGKVDKVAGKGLSTNDYDAAAVAEVAKIKDKADASVVEALAEKVNGRSTAYTFANESDTKYLEAVGKAGSFVIGDTIYFTDTDIPDKWVTGVNEEAPYYTFQYIETEKPNLTDYVPKTTTVNGKALSTNIELTATDVGAATPAEVATAKGEAVTEAGTAADGKIAEALKAYTTTEALNTELGKKVDKVTGKSLVDDTLITKMEGIKDNAVIKGVEGGIKLDAETGKISIDAATVPVIAQAKVDGLVDKLAEVDAAIAEKKDEAGVNALIAAATIEAGKINGAVAEATKVTNALTAGGKVFDGSEAVEITAADLGALTAIPQATAGALGGIKVGFEKSGNKLPVELEEGKAFVEIPAAIQYAAGNGLALDDSTHTFSIAEGGVVTSMIADAAITDAKIAKVNVNKLEQTEGDTLILDGGNSASF